MLQQKDYWRAGGVGGWGVKGRETELEVYSTQRPGEVSARAGGRSWSSSSRCFGKGSPSTDGSVISEHKAHKHTASLSRRWHRTQEKSGKGAPAALFYYRLMCGCEWAGTEKPTVCPVCIKLGMRLMPHQIYCSPWSIQPCSALCYKTKTVITDVEFSQLAVPESPKVMKWSEEILPPQPNDTLLS